MNSRVACASLVIAMLIAAGPALAAGAPPAAKPAPAAAPSLEPSVEKKPDANLAARAIRGKFTPPERVQNAMLWERSMDLKIPVAVDPKTGAFEAKTLRLGTYNFVIKTPWGRLEGVDMTPRVSEYDILIPPEYRTEDLGKPPEGTLSDEDTKGIRLIIYGIKHYENKVRDLYLTGTSDKAVALMELMQDTDFHSRKGDEITWRMEQWFYEKKYGGWLTFRTRCLYRFRVSGAAWATWGWQFEPALGGIDITEDRKEPVTIDYTIPEKPIAEKGLTGNQYPPAEKGIPKEAPPPDEAK